MRYLSSLSPEPMGRRGFTLIELVAVLFIIAVSTAIVAINFGRSSDRAMLRDEVIPIRYLGRLTSTSFRKSNSLARKMMEASS